jgi:hypothetical protein
MTVADLQRTRQLEAERIVLLSAVTDARGGKLRWANFSRHDNWKLILCSVSIQVRLWLQKKSIPRRRRIHRDQYAVVADFLKSLDRVSTAAKSVSHVEFAVGQDRGLTTM